MVALSNLGGRMVDCYRLLLLKEVNEKKWVKRNV